MENNRSDMAFLLLRTFFSAMLLLVYGWPKLVKLFTETPIDFVDPFGFGPTISLGFAVFAEALCPLLIIVGIATRWACIPIMTSMLIGVYLHLGSNFVNVERPMLYLFVFAVIFLNGPGKFALDHFFKDDTL